MRLVYVPPTAPEKHAALRGIEIEAPDCLCCRDQGQVMTPTTDFRGRSYVGHGPGCECGSCKAWPQPMRDWAERRVMARPSLAVPKEALEALAAGKAQTYDVLYPCPECENGIAFKEWANAPLFSGAGRTEPKKPFKPSGWKVVDYDTPNGRALVDLHLEINGGKQLKRVIPKSLDAVSKFLPKPLLDATRLKSALHESDEYCEVKTDYETRERARQGIVIRPEEVRL